jgi:methionine-rich copper-binding protein CopC
MTVTSPLRGSRRRAAVALISLLWLGVAATASAHSELVSSDPEPGSTIGPVRDTPIVLTFSASLKAGSKADIVGPAGKLGTATVDPANRVRLVYTPARPLEPGGWTIEWTSIATDGDVLRGKILFSVAVLATPTPSPTASAAQSIPAPTPTAALSPSPSPTPPPGPASSTGADVLLPVIAAILAIAVLGLVLLRSRRASARR